MFNELTSKIKKIGKKCLSDTVKNRKWYIIALFLFSLASFPRFVAGATPVKIVPPEERNLKVYYVEKPPVIDGRPYDECWQKADVAKDFTLIGGTGYPTQKTEVRALYDAKNLYLLFTCFDTEIDKVRALTPPDNVDNQIGGDDAVEVFLDTNHDHKSYFQIMTSAAAVKFDMSSKEGMAWNGQWQVKDFRDKNAWYLEFAIPFTSLANVGELAGTPKPNDVWGVNFNRDIARTSEWVNWSTCFGGFHQPKRFGQLLFQDSQKMPRPQITVLDIGSPNFGKSGIRFKVVNPDERDLTLDFTLKLKKDANVLLDEEEYSFSIPAKGMREVSIPYAIMDGGDLELLVRAADTQGKLFYQWRRPLRLPELYGSLKEVNAILQHLKKGVADFSKEPRIKDVATLVSRQENILNTLLERYKNRSDFTSEQWKAFQEEVAQLRNDAASSERRFLVLGYKLQTEKLLKNPKFCVGNATTFDHVFSDEVFRGPINQPISLQAARNESESAQLVVIPFGEKLRNMQVSVSNLVSKNGKTLDRKHFKVFRVLDTYRERPTEAKPDFREAWPDPLLPLTGPFDLAPGRSYPIWLTVYIPERQAPGSYKGTITFHADNAPALSLNISVQVWDFSLPLVPSLATDMWLTLEGIWPWYYPNQDFPLEAYKKLALFCQRHRINPYPHDTAYTTFRTKIIREKDGSYTFDYSAIDRVMEIAFQHGATAWNVNFSGNDRWTGLFRGAYGRQGLTIYDKRTGKTEEYPPLEKRPLPESDVWKEGSLYRQFLRDYWRHIKEKGWDKTAYWESIDEPNTIDRVNKLKHDYAIIRKEMPGIKTLSFGVPQPGGRFKGALVGYIGQWAPMLRYFPDYEAELRRYQQQGDSVWIYTCSRGIKKGGGKSPDTMIDTPLIEKRIIPWMAWKYHIQGYLNFMISGFNLNPQMKKTPQERWPNTPWIWVKKEGRFGQRYYIYPGPEGVCSSLRLEQIRDGLEDYDYFYLLRAKVEEIRSLAGDAYVDFITESERLLTIGPDIVTSVFKYTHDGSRLLERRKKLAYQIEKANKIIKQIQASSREGQK